MIFPLVMYGCENWTIKKAEHQRTGAFETEVLKKTQESPLNNKEIKPVNLEGNQPWIFIGRTDAEAKAPILGHLMGKADSLEKTLILGKTEGMKRSGRQDEMVGWHHRLSGHELEQTLRDGEGRKSRMLQSMGSQSRTWLSDWTTTIRL